MCKKYGMKNTVKRLRISKDIEEFHRDYYSEISFQKFVEIALENEKRRKMKRRLITPF